MARSKKVPPLKLKRVDSGVRFYRREDLEPVVRDEVADNDMQKAVDSLNDKSRQAAHYIVELMTPVGENVSNYTQKLLGGATLFAADLAVVEARKVSSSKSTLETTCQKLEERFKDGHGVVLVEVGEGVHFSERQQKRLDKVQTFIEQLNLPAALVKPPAEVSSSAAQPAVLPTSAMGELGQASVA